MAETWLLHLFDGHLELPAPESVEGLLGLSLWDRSTNDVETLAVLRFDEMPTEGYDAALAEAGWPEPLWRARLAMAAIPPWAAEEMDGEDVRTVHLGRFPAKGDAEAARLRRDAYVAERQDPDGEEFWGDDVAWQVGEDEATGDAWTIPVSVPRNGYSSEEIGLYGDELSGLIAETDMPDGVGGEFHAYVRRL